MIFFLLTALAGPLDPCSLLDPKAIAAVQGAAPRETKPSTHADGPFTAKQCLFMLPDFARSVSFEVTSPNAGTKTLALQQRWELLSGKGKERKQEPAERVEDRDKRAPAGEEEEGGSPPRPVTGVGRAAVWVGNARAGALYVLAPAAILRVSVGGAADESAKIKACAVLARNALRRLARAVKRG